MTHYLVRAMRQMRSTGLQGSDLERGMRIGAT